MKAVIDSGCLEYKDLPENVLYQFFHYNLYFERQNEMVGIYWKNDNDIFEQYSVEAKFDYLRILETKVKTQEKQHDESLLFDDGIPEKNNNEDLIKDIQRQIEELKRKLEGGYSESNVVAESKVVEQEYCYVLIKYDNGRARIKELVSNKIIVDNFNIKDYKRISDIFYPNSHDFIIQLSDIDNSIISLLSLFRGYLFGPYKYKTIELFENGLIVDEKYLIEYENNVGIFDISDFERIKNPYDVIYNKNKKICYIIYRRYCSDQDSFIRLYPLEVEGGEDDKEEVYMLETKDYIFSYNATSKRARVETLFSLGGEWTDEDAWDVLTEGDHGDYPGPYWDLEDIGLG